jgi:hypothetical protein
MFESLGLVYYQSSHKTCNLFWDTEIHYTKVDSISNCLVAEVCPLSCQLITLTTFINTNSTLTPCVACVNPRANLLCCWPPWVHTAAVPVSGPTPPITAGIVNPWIFYDRMHAVARGLNPDQDQVACSASVSKRIVASLATASVAEYSWPKKI